MHIMTIALVLYPVLAMYGTESVSFGDIFLLFVTFVCGVNSRGYYRKPFRPNKVHIYFLVYCAAITLVRLVLGKYILISAVLKRFAKYAFFISVIYVSKNTIDAEEFYRYYRKLVTCVFIVLIIQYVLYYGANIVFVPKIPLLPYIGTISVDVQRRTLSYAFRPGSFLGEPGACSYVILPYLCYALFRKDQEIKKRDVFIATLSIIMTASSAGLICVGIIYSALLLKIIFSLDEPLQKKIGRITGLCAVLIIAYMVFIATPLSQSLNRLIVNESTGETAVAWGKTTAGNQLLESLSPFERIVGIGFGNIDMSTLSNYSNGVNYLLICTGYAGLAIMLLWAYQVFLNTNYAGKVTAAIFCALCISCRIIISYNMMYFNIFATLDDKNSNYQMTDQESCGE